MKATWQDKVLLLKLQIIAVTVRTMCRAELVWYLCCLVGGRNQLRVVSCQRYRSTKGCISVKCTVKFLYEEQRRGSNQSVRLDEDRETFAELAELD